MPNTYCPGCGGPAGPAEPYCRRCGIWLAGPQVAELRRIEGMLAQVATIRTQLIGRRTTVLNELNRLASQASAGRSAGGAAGRAAPTWPTGRPGAWPESGARPARPEISGRTAARLLLAAGVSLVVIAVIIFTIAGWSRIGPLGRCAILLGASALVLAAPRPLIRRGLIATAESVAAVGLALTVGDAYLLQRVFPSPGAAGSLLAAAVGSAALAAAWAGYGAWIKLKGPWLAALGLAQFPAPLAMAGFVLLLRGPAAPLVGPVALGVIVTCGADVWLAGRTSGQKTVSTAASVTAVTTWACAILLEAPGAVAALFRPVGPVWSGSGPGGALPPGLLGGAGTSATLALASLAALFAPGKLRRPGWSAGLVAAALAAGSGAAHLTGWAALAALTATAAILLGLSLVLRDRTLAGVAAGSGGTLAVTAALWSLAAPVATISELATLTVIFGLTAVRARYAFTAALATAGALAAVTGLAWAVPLASGWPARHAAFAALAVAVVAVTTATVLRRACPVHSVVLDLGAGPVALLSAAVTAGQQDAFAVVAVTAAMIASGTAWLRTGQRRLVAVVAAGCAAAAALASQGRPLARALLAPGPVIAHPWRHLPIVGGSPVLPVAVIVLAACLAALVTAVGAWRGRGRASLDAVAVALPLVAAPAGLAAGIGYWLVVATLLALTLALTAWAAAEGPGKLGTALGRSMAPVAAALVSAALTIAWALAAPVPTLVVLASLTAAYALGARWSRLASVCVAAGSLSVLAAAALAECLVAAAHRPGWQAGLAALAVGAGVQLGVALTPGRAASPSARGATGVHAADEIASAGAAITLGIGLEATAWLVAAAGLAQCLGRPWPASVALAAAGLLCLGVAARADRRPAIWPGLALCYAAWCVALAAAGVGVAEAYTGPAAVIALGIGWRASRREPEPHSWLGCGPGLVLLLLPSLILAWHDPGWIRPVLTGLAAAVIAVAGARSRKQAPLVTGAIVAMLDAGRQLAPPAVHLVQALPGWVPVAAGGATLLWAGATYERRLRDLARIRKTLADMS